MLFRRCCFYIRSVFLILFIASFLTACGSALKKDQSDSICFKIVAQNDLQALLNTMPECLGVKTLHGTTPLMLAAAKGHHLIVDALIKAGADVNEPDLQGDTALSYAVSRSQVDVAQLLILNQAKVTPRRADRISTLMQAVQQGSYQMVQVLSQDQDGINIQAEDGWTALYFAIRRQDEYILRILLRRGACPDVLDSYNQTPIEFAEEVGWVKGQEILKKVRPCKATDFQRK